MSEHHRTRQDHSGRVSTVSAHDVLRDVSASGFEEGIFLQRSFCQYSRTFGHCREGAHPADVAAWHYTRPTNKRGTNV